MRRRAPGAKWPAWKAHNVRASLERELSALSGAPAPIEFHAEVGNSEWSGAALPASRVGLFAFVPHSQSMEAPVYVLQDVRRPAGAMGPLATGGRIAWPAEHVLLRVVGPRDPWLRLEAVRREWRGIFGRELLAFDCDGGT